MIALFQHEDGIPIPSATESPDFVYTFYALISTSNTGEWTVNIDTSALVTLDDVATAIATAVATKEGLIKNAAVKNSIADADAVAVVDSADDSKTKRVLWSTIKAALNQLFVPLTRKINSKALSADVTLTGDDIKTSASDSTTLSSSLSNLIADHGIKTYRDYTQIGLSGSEITIAQIFESLPAGSTLYANNTPTSCLTSTERPTVTVYGFLIARKVSSAFAIMEWHCPSNDDGSVIGNYTSAYRTVSSPSWSGWALEPTATPPQEFDLPLLDGWYTNDRAQYRKTQEGLVVVNAILVLSEGYSASDNTQIAVLPEGFRPATSFMYPVSVQDSGTRSSAIVQIGTNGTITYYGASNTTAVFRVYLNAAFFAAS